MGHMQRQTLINNPVTLDPAEIRTLVEHGEQVVVQFSQPGFDAVLLDELDALCRQYGDAIRVRFYGFHGQEFDCSVLSGLPNVRNLTLDSYAVANFSALQRLENLQRLHVGIFELKAPNFLSWPNLHGLTHLGLGGTRRAHFDLRPLEQFRDLRRLFVDGHTKNIDAIGSLPALADLTLQIAHTASIAFVNRLAALRSLTFMLGGRVNLDELEDCPIEELEIIRVKGFEALDRIERFPRLRRLLIEDQLRLTQLSFDHEMPALEDLRVLNCKQFVRLDGLGKLGALKHLRIYGTALDFDTMIAQPLPAPLEIVGFYTGRSRADEVLRLRLQEMGYWDGLSPR
jgi:protein phosphatase 1 regulatory subunit 7